MAHLSEMLYPKSCHKAQDQYSSVRPQTAMGQSSLSLAIHRQLTELYRDQQGSNNVRSSPVSGLAVNMSLIFSGHLF